uniref:Ycf49 n=1 Tax=Sciadococcus taiwanensis TaxID=3028030 RepID=A0A9Y1I257_9RHOD|nr:hypothetical protein SCTW_112 [Sciadococcus taiwanensis]
MHYLSLPNWIIHSATLIEWIIAIEITWQYAYRNKSKEIISLTYAMLIAFISASSACTWHIFNNLAYLEWLVILQSLSTFMSNMLLLLTLSFS